MNGVLADFYSWLYQIPLSGYIRFRYITFLGISDSVISVSVISDSTFVISYSVISNSNLVISDSLYQSPLYQNLLYQKDHPHPGPGGDATVQIRKAQSFTFDRLIGRSPYGDRPSLDQEHFIDH